MLKTIFTFEIKRWFKSWNFYLFLVIFFALGFLTMAAMVGYFDDFSVTTASNTYENSPIAINNLINSISSLISFLIPTIIGATVYRDFQSNIYTILYSYPFTKRDYLLGKFLSGLFITSLIVLAVALGMILATLLPFANQDLLAPFSLWSYLQAFIYFALPNIFLIGAFAFMLTTFTRNEYVGYIFVLITMIISGILGALSANVDDKFYFGLFDYSGGFALNYLTEYWTIHEQNVNNIPFHGVLLYNRLIWISVGFFVFGLTYVFFKFDFNPISLFGKKKGERVIKNNFDTDLEVNLPKISFDYSFTNYLKVAWNLSAIEFKSIRKNWLFWIFIAVMMISLVISGLQVGSGFMGAETYPTSGFMLNIVESNLGTINLLIILFAGILLNQARTTRMNLLVDATAIPNWALFLSKGIALMKMALSLLFINIIGAIILQFTQGFYDINYWVYLEFIVKFTLIIFILNIMYAMFVQSLFNKFYIGFIVILLLNFLPVALSKIGVELNIFHYKSGPGIPRYSEFIGFGSAKLFWIYKIYWTLFTTVLICLALLLYKRGILTTKERISQMKTKAKKPVVITMIVSAIAFVSLGYTMYREMAIKEPYYTENEYEKMRVDYEKKYKKYQDYAQPRIVAANVHLDLFPESRDYKAVGYFTMVNKSQQVIDSLFLPYGDNLKEVIIDKGYQTVYNDSVMDFKILKLNQSLQPGDSLQVQFTTQNEPNTWFKNNSFVLSNGTFVNNRQLFPSFGYTESMEIRDNDIRKKYNLPPRERMPVPNDEKARQNTYIAHDADWIDFETTVSTSENQIAIAPGYLQNEWQKDARRYFHYKMDSKILNFYAYNSGTYEVLREKKNGINYEVYYLKGHEYNIDRMMESMQNSIEYYSANFSPYTHKQARIIEFPSVMGTFAQAFANTMPYSEGIGFLAKIDTDNPDNVDYPYSVVSHEMAHQWWAHQVIGAEVQGATMLSESLSEYSSLKVLEQKYGRSQMHKFLKDALDSYLRGRTYEWKEENPLMYNENQQYIHYNKGALVFYALGEYIGTENLHKILRSFVAEKAFQEAPYTNSLEFVVHLKKHIPANYQYLIEDMIETITLYNNKVLDTKVTPLKNGEYQVDISFQVAKYRTKSKGEEIYKDKDGNTLEATIGKDLVKSLPLNDVVVIGIFGEKTKKGKYEYENPLYYSKVRVNKIKNKVSFIVKEKPVQVGVDPYNILIDRDSNDNRKKV